MSAPSHKNICTPRALMSGILFFGVFVLGVGMLRGESSVLGYFDLRRSQSGLDKVVKDLQSQNRELSEEIMRLKKSKSYAKKVLRDKYHVTEPDENIVFFAD